MAGDNDPVCARHPEIATMRIRTIHTRASLPDQVLAVYECPVCGFERRLPLPLDPQTPSVEVEIPGLPAPGPRIAI